MSPTLVQASRDSSYASSPSTPPSSGNAVPAGQQGPQPAMSRNSMSLSQTKGLLNAPGQNNCFLNSAVQVLWHLDIFRRSFRDLGGHACMADSCIFCALKELFAQFQYSNESALPPDALRRALAETFFNQQRFQLGFMDDAAECFENILLRIHFHIANAESEDMCNAVHCISHQKFAMTLVEQSVCHACGATSEPLPFTQMVHYVSASALCTQAKQMWKEGMTVFPEFGQLLRKAGGMGDIRDCPSACGAKIQICRTLMNCPEIVSVGIVWDSERPTLQHIMNVFSTIGTTVRLQDMFHSVVDSRWAMSAVHQLVGVVTYYGKHYSTFFFHTKLRVWIYFDDATVREIGPRWEQVVQKCHRGHFQPLLLLYANPHGAPVSTKNAPQTVTYVSGHAKRSREGYTKGRSCMRAGEDTTDVGSKRGNISMAVAAQRRALTPNPDLGHSVSRDTHPRRAITPNPDVHSQHPYSPSIGGHLNISETAQIAAMQYHRVQKLSSDAFLSSEHGLSNGAFQPVHRQRSLSTSSVSARSEGPSSLSSFPTRSVGSIDCNGMQKVAPATRVQGQEEATGGTNQLPESGTTRPKSDTSSADSIYISRKAVESVLNFQKLQRQRSLGGGHGTSGLGCRTSSSSLESLENSLWSRSHHPPILLPTAFQTAAGCRGSLDTQESSSGSSITGSPGGNHSRRRDSGNWSGDRNSASSSSSVTMENPFFFVVNNKQRTIPLPCQRINQHPKMGVELASNPSYDPGYDSYSLSSNDSFPLSFPPKHSQQLAQIPEVPANKIMASVIDATISQRSCINGAIDECERLCIDADGFLENSRELEDVGDFLGAISLCNSAAAKARAAMDAPYTNPQTIMFARMKHNTCVMRARSLHRRYLMRQESINSHGSTTSTETDSGSIESKVEGLAENAGRWESSHSRQGSRDSGRLAGKESSGHHSRQSSKDSSSHHSRQGSRDGQRSSSRSTPTNIEIYATLPKKAGKKRDVEKAIDRFRTGSVRAKDEQKLFQNYGIQQPMLDRSESVRDSKRVKDKLVNVDPEFSDYGSEWEQTKKPSLHRTLSSPPSLKPPVIMSQSQSDLSKAKPEQLANGKLPGKKQHKIRRKLLMGGLIKRKNRSMPDLRDGAEGGGSAQVGPQGQSQKAFDDLHLSRQGVEKTLTGYLSDAHLDYTHRAAKGIYGSQRQLHQRLNKIPPQPPARTSSQLTTSSKSQVNLATAAQKAAVHQMQSPMHHHHAGIGRSPMALPQPEQLSHGSLHQPMVPLTAGVKQILVQAEVHHERTPSDNVRPVILGRPSECLQQNLPDSHIRQELPTKAAAAHPQYVNSPHIQTYQHPLNSQMPNCASNTEMDSNSKSTSFPRANLPSSQQLSTGSQQGLNKQSSQQASQNIVHLQQQQAPTCHQTNNCGSHIRPDVKPQFSNPTNSLDEVDNANTLAGRSSLLTELQAKRQQMLDRKSQSVTADQPKKDSESGSWLHELQVKQMQIFQRRLSTGGDENNNAKVVGAVIPPVQLVEARNSTCQKTATIEASLQQPKRSPESANPGPLVCIGDGDKPLERPKSVRDLASRFEQITLPGASATITQQPTKVQAASVQFSSYPREVDKWHPATTEATDAANGSGSTLPVRSSDQMQVQSRQIVDHRSKNGQPSAVDGHFIAGHVPAKKDHIDTNGLSNGVTSLKSPPSTNFMIATSANHVQNQQFPQTVHNGPQKMMYAEGVYYVVGNHSGVRTDRKMPNGFVDLGGQQPSQITDVPVGNCSIPGAPSLQYHYQFGNEMKHPGNPANTTVGICNASNGHYTPSYPAVLGNVDYRYCVEKVRKPHPHQQNVIHHISNMSLQPMGQQQPKIQSLPIAAENHTLRTQKKKGIKKSVTFSDQIALVASAADDDDSYLPNPLLERVYKKVVKQQHQHQQPTPTSATNQTIAQNSKLNNVPVNKAPTVAPHLPANSVCYEPTIGDSSQMNVAQGRTKSNPSKVPCHLCRKKSVVPPVVYCPDCDFYMSRFKPKC